MELPEVEVMRRDLEKDVVGRRIKQVEVRPSPNALRTIRRHAKPGKRGVRKEFASLLESRKITKVERKGKYLLLHLEGGDILVVHFGMSGQFIRATKRQPLPAHTHVVITFQQGGDLRFVDPRTFGEQLAQRASKLKPLLMDQKFVSGLGNIYSDEVLFAAGLRHDRMSDSLSSQEVRRLYRAIQEIVQEAIRHRGTTLDDEAYVDLFGRPGEFQRELKVYGRKGQPCRRCRTPIQSVTVGGRRSYFCPQCQS